MTQFNFFQKELGVKGVVVSGRFLKQFAFIEHLTCISCTNLKIKEDKFPGRKHISEDIAIGDFKNFFILIRKDWDACNFYYPNQRICRRAFVNIGDLTNNPKWMKIDLQTILPELGQAHDMFFTNLPKMNTDAQKYFEDLRKSRKICRFTFGRFAKNMS